MLPCIDTCNTDAAKGERRHAGAVTLQVTRVGSRAWSSISFGFSVAVVCSVLGYYVAELNLFLVVHMQLLKLGTSFAWRSCMLC